MDDLIRSVVKQCRNALTPLSKKATANDVCEERRRLDSAQRAVMKELFQRDIDDTVAEMLTEETSCDSAGIAIARGLAGDFDGKWLLHYFIITELKLM